ncbi:DNA polymerase I [Bacillus sp. JCM 19046]|nr:DNA polymerase I [Bacillus sp. JCM 19045]GAF19900.1 DNA polymerase I [Bacillus sp. JCM 19046]
MQNERLLLIDGFNLLSRGYFATSFNRPIETLERSEDGITVNGLRVFMQKLFKLIQTHGITHCVVTWDVPRDESIRRLDYPEYKQTRGELPDPLIEQYVLLKQVLEKMSISQLTLAPYEADDLIGALSLQWEQQTAGSCLIYSNDQDLYQLLSERTHQIINKKKQEFIYDAQAFQLEHGIQPDQWIDVKALLGDPGDNIPGCPGVGQKTALPLIQTYGSIENLHETLADLDPQFKRVKSKLDNGKDVTYLSKKLASIIRDIPDLPSLSSFALSLHRETIEEELTRLKIRVPFEQGSLF